MGKYFKNVTKTLMICTPLGEVDTCLGEWANANLHPAVKMNTFCQSHGTLLHQGSTVTCLVNTHKGEKEEQGLMTSMTGWVSHWFNVLEMARKTM